MQQQWSANNPYGQAPQQQYPPQPQRPPQQPMYGGGGFQLPAITSQPQLAPVSDRQAYGGSGGSVHSYGRAETRGFSDYLNQILSDDPDLRDVIPLNPESEDLFQVASRGLLLCKLINKIKPGTINEKKIITKPNPSKFEVVINHELAIQGAKELGCNIINIDPSDLMNATPHAVLGLVWQAVKVGLLSQVSVESHPELVVLMEANEDVANFMNMMPEQNLLRWFNYHLRRAGHPRQVRNFGSDIADAENYLVLLNQIAPGVVPRDAVREPNPNRRADLVCEFADRLNCRKFVAPQDILAGNEKLNMAFTAYLFDKYPGLDVPDDNVNSARLQRAEQVLQEKFKQEDEQRRLRWAQEEAERQARWQEEEAERLRRLEEEEAAKRAALAALSEQERLQREALERETQEKRRQLEMLEAQHRQMEENQRRQDMMREQQRLEEEERRRRWEAEQRRREMMANEEAAKRREEEIRRQEEERRRRWEEEQRRIEEETMRREEERQRMLWEQEQARQAMAAEQARLEEQKRRLAADALELQRQQAWAQYNTQQAEMQRQESSRQLAAMQQTIQQQQQQQQMAAWQQQQTIQQQQQQQWQIQQQQLAYQQQQAALQRTVTQTTVMAPPPTTTVTTTTTLLRGRYPIPRLVVSIIRGRRMSKKDTLGKSDPYVVLMHNGLKFKTSTIRNTQDPVWNQDFEFRPVMEGDEIVINAMDYDRFSKDDFMGEIRLNKQDFDNPGERWYQLNSRTYRNDKVHGDILIRITAYDR